MAAGTSGAVALAGLGTTYHEFARCPGGRAFWKERAYLFGEDFRRHIEDDLMKRTPHPDAKLMSAFSIGQRVD